MSGTERRRLRQDYPPQDGEFRDGEGARHLLQFRIDGADAVPDRESHRRRNDQRGADHGGVVIHADGQIDDDDDDEGRDRSADRHPWSEQALGKPGAPKQGADHERGRERDQECADDAVGGDADVGPEIAFLVRLLDRQDRRDGSGQDIGADEVGHRLPDQREEKQRGDDIEPRAQAIRRGRGSARGRTQTCGREPVPTR